MSEQDLKRILWGISNDLRGSMDATKFKDYILGFIFYKFLCTNLVDKIKEIEPSMTYEELYEDDVETLKEESINLIGYFIKPQFLFSTFEQRAEEKQIILDDFSEALKEIENSTLGHESQDDFQGLFSDLNLYSTDLGRDATDKNNRICMIITRLSEVDFKTSETNTDVLGDAYEYMISMFASDAGKKAGEFYTPQEVSKLLTKIITSDKNNVRSVYDPTCGSGSLLLRVAKEFDLKNMDLIAGEEKNTTTFNLCRMNMLIHNVSYDRFMIRNTDTIEDPKFLDKKFDAVVANPPFSAKWDNREEHSEDPRFREYTKLAPKTKADLAFVQHMLYQIKEDGIVATLLPHGPLFRGAAEKAIREKLLKDNKIDAIIGLPANIFSTTSIPTIILVLKKCKEDDKVLFIDASDKFKKIKTKNVMDDDHIKEIMEIFKTREEKDKFSHLATLKEIEENDYNLNIPRYVDKTEEEEPIDIAKVEKEINELELESARLTLEIEEMKKELVETGV